MPLRLSQGIKQGIEDGKRGEKIQIAKELFKLGLNIDDIEKVTKLTKDEIKKYVTNLKRR